MVAAILTIMPGGKRTGGRVVATCANPSCGVRRTVPAWRLRRVKQWTHSVACRDVVAALRTDRLLPKGGRIYRDGYVYRHVGRAHHHADGQGYAPEHFLVVEAILARRLTGAERVRRISVYRDDNRPEVLFVVTPDGSWNVTELAQREAVALAQAGVT